MARIHLHRPSRRALGPHAPVHPSCRGDDFDHVGHAEEAAEVIADLFALVEDYKAALAFVSEGLAAMVASATEPETASVNGSPGAK